MNEQEWKTHHVIYRNHSVLLILMVGVILICLLFKVYTLTRRWIPPCLYRKVATTTPAVRPENKENFTDDSNISSEDSLKVAKHTPLPSPAKASHSSVVTAHF